MAQAFGATHSASASGSSWDSSHDSIAASASPSRTWAISEAQSSRSGSASSIRERIYVDLTEGRYGILLYTASPDAEGTLGGLVQEARHLELHLANALDLGALCSNDPICAQHDPGRSLEERWLHGAACHGCTLISETCCEMRNEYLDRALVIPVLGCADAAFFGDHR